MPTDLRLSRGTPRGHSLCPPPSVPLLRWLTDDGPRVPPGVQAVLLARLFTTPSVVAMGVLNCLVPNVAALFLHFEPAFAVYIAVDLAVAGARLAVLRRADRATARGVAPPIDLYLVTAILWCALQGMMAFTAMQTGCAALQVLSATMIIGLIGPICARNYPAPRLAFLMVCLCHLPFLAGAVLSDDRWLLILVLQAPLFLLGTARILKNYQMLAVAALKGEQASQHLALHDPLTGLLNRLGFNNSLAQLAADTQRRLTMLCLDLDGFKQVNDTLGHPVGDTLLQAVSRRLEACVRPGDAVIRLGGDEFVILARDLSPDDAAEFAERIIGRVTDEPYLMNGVRLVRIGLSIGFACVPEDGEDLEEIHRRADAALYVAKADGKGVQRRFRSAPDIPQRSPERQEEAKRP